MDVSKLTTSQFVSPTKPRTGLARLLSLAIDHVDNLLEDWYPDLGVRFMVSSQGRFLITRMSPCPSCVSNVTTNSDAKEGGGGAERDAAANAADDGCVDHRSGSAATRRNADGVDDDDDDDDESWELLDEDFNRKPAVVDLVTLEKQQREAFQNGPSPTSGERYIEFSNQLL